MNPQPQIIDIQKTTPRDAWEQIMTSQFMPAFEQGYVPANGSADNGIRNPEDSKFLAVNLNSSKANINMSGGSNNGSVLNPSAREFLAVSGAVKRKVFCKAAGLSGKELRLCKAKIKAVCGRKPLFGADKKNKWADCARNLFVEYEKEVKAGVPEPEEDIPGKGGAIDTGTGMDMTTKIAIGAGVLLLVGGAIALIAAARKRRVITQPAV